MAGTMPDVAAGPNRPNVADDYVLLAVMSEWAALDLNHPRLQQDV